jgi:hypothetical protein
MAVAASAGQATGVLAATITPDPALVHDGDGVATVALADVGSTDLRLRHVRTTIRVRAPARVSAVRSGSGWHCAVGAGGVVDCTPAAAVVQSASLAPIDLVIGAVRERGRPASGRANLQVRATWTQPGIGGRPVTRTSTAGLVVNQRAPLTIAAHPVQKTVIDPVARVPTTPTILEGSVGRRTREPINVEWRQLCGRGNCPRVKWTTATRGPLLDGQQPEASFITPHVERARVLRFELSASDPRGTVRAVTAVRVEPDQIERIDPKVRSVSLAGDVLRSSERQATGLRLSKADEAVVTVSAPGPYRTHVNGLVVLNAKVAAQRVSRTSWSVAAGPRSMLAGARRSRTQLRFRAPPVPGTYAVRMTARTAAGRFTRDELIEVNPAVRASAGVANARGGRAQVANAGGSREQAFCKVVAESRQHGKIAISLPSGGTFAAEAGRPTGSECSGSETITFHDGRTTLGSFELMGVHGTITRDRGLVISGGTLHAPSFWDARPESASDSNVRVVHGTLASRASAPGGGLAIGFEVPRTGGIGVGLEIPLSGGGFGDLVGAVTVDKSALAKFPLASSLPGGWTMTKISLAVAPDARRFELSADANGPASTGGELSLNGVLTFDGQVSVSVTGSNLAVFESSGGQQATLTASGTLTLLPGRRFDPANPNAAGSYVPVIDVSVSAKISDYRLAENMTFSGAVSWSSSGPLEVEGTLVTSVKGNKLRAVVNGSFEDANNWRLFASLETGGDGLAIGDPALLKLKLLQGELTRNGGKLSVSLKGEASDIHLVDGLKANTAALEFTTDCQFRGEQGGPPPGSRLCLLVDSTSEVTVPGASAPLKLTGAVKLDLKTLKFEAEGHLNAGEPFGPKQFKLEDVNLFVTNAAPAGATCTSVARAAEANGLYFGFTAKGEVLGVHLNITGAYLGGNQKHFCMGAEIGGANLPTGNSDQLTALKANGPASCSQPNSPTLQALRFEYSSDTEIGRFSGKFCLPSGVREKLGRVGTGVGGVDLYVSKDGFEGKASYDLGGRTAWFLNARNQDTPDPTKAALGFSGMSVRVWATTTKGLGIGLDANGEISMPAPTAASGGTGEGARAPVAVGVAATLRPAPELTFTTTVGENVAGQPCNATTARIKNAFGAAGFNICQFGLQGSIGASGPSLGVNAKFTLPTDWGQRLGVKNASLEIGFNISAQTPCLDLAVKRANPQAGPALDLFDKRVIVANEADMVIAPNGCSLPGKAPAAAGIHLAFDGTLFGTATKVDLKIQRLPAGLKIAYTQRTGASTLGPLKFGATAIDVLLDPGPPAQAKLELHTSLTIGSGGIKIDGAFNHSGGNTTLDASACLIRSASADQPPQCGEVNVLGAKFAGMLRLHFETGTRTVADFSGRLSADLRVLDTTVDVQTLRYDSTAGGLQTLAVTANSGFRLGSVEGHIGGGVTYKRAESEIGLSLTGRVKLWGFETSFHLPARLSTNITLPFEFGPGANTTRISEPKSLLVLRLKGKLDGHVNRNGSVAVDHVLPIQGCFPFETVCVNIGDARVNTANGTVTFKVFGYDVVIDASKYVKNTPGQVDFSPGISYVANEQTGKCLDVNFANFSDGTRIKEEHCATTRNTAQEFKLLSDGTLRVRNKEGREFCVSGVNREPQLAGCDARRSDERWTRDDKGQIKGNAANTIGLCLDINTSSKFTTLNGACGNSGRWVIVDMLQRPGVGCLDVPQGNLASELKVFPECNRSANQAFALYPNGELKVRGQCVAATEIKAAAAVKLADCNGSRPQLWFLDLGALCTGAINGFDYRQAQCMATRPKEGAYFPVRLSPLDINGKRNSDSNLRWDVTF